MKYLCILACFTCALSAGYVSGRAISVKPNPLRIVPEIRLTTPTVQIDGIRNGLLHGRIRGSARVIFGDSVLTQSGVFAIDATTLLRNTIEVVVPSEAQYVASQKGKKYYPVFSAGGSRIVPQNRVYFRTKQEAESAGFSE